MYRCVANYRSMTSHHNCKASGFGSDLLTLLRTSEDKCSFVSTCSSIVLPSDESERYGAVPLEIAGAVLRQSSLSSH